MSEITDAFADCISAFADATGMASVITARGEAIPALVEDVSVDEIEAMGGIADSGGFRATVRASEFLNPETLETVEYEGRAMRLLSFRNLSGLLELTCGEAR